MAFASLYTGQGYMRLWNSLAFNAERAAMAISFFHADMAALTGWTLIRLADMPVEEVTHGGTYLFSMRFKGEVARVIKAYFSVRQITFPGFCARWHEEGIVFSPYG